VSPSSQPDPAAPPAKPRVRPYADAPRIPAGDAIDPRELVDARGRPVELELGPGRGGFVFERLAADPELVFVGLEIRRKWATIVDRRLTASEHAGRGRIFAEDGRLVLPRFVAGSIARAFIHFPDPWWKKRHHKRLLIGAPLLAELVRVLAPGGELFIQTDVEERADGYEALCNACPGLAPASNGPRLAENPFGARSPREKRAIADGLPIYRLLYRRGP
jgi:tRNA (guanine-N7-)-methyltransferase